MGINEDETIEMILSKIIYNCYKRSDITLSNIYAWYENDKNEMDRHLSEEDSIYYKDFYDKSINSMIDTSMVDSNGDKIPKPILNKSLTLYENCVNQDIIYSY